VNLYKIYKLLLDHFGEQGWWPTTKEGGYKPEHRGERPKVEKERLEIVVGAILTQNTSWKNVEKAIENLNRKGLMDIHKLNHIDKKELARLIRSSGYYNQKAQRIKDFVSFVIDKYEGKLENLFSLDIEDLRNELLSIKGIGKETADSIILYSALKPIFVIDAYTKRIVERLGITNDKDYDQLQRIFMESLPKDQKIFAEYHALLVRLGKEYCKKREPRCKDCPLRKLCKYPKSMV